MKQTRITKTHIVSVTAIVLVFFCAFAGYYLLNPKEEANTITAIDRLMILPKNEKPAQLTIVDKKKVQASFLQKADNGDKVLIYQNNKRFVIYRPSVNKIVDTGFIEIDDVTSIGKD